ncbi:Esterase/lipase/thioesterase [Heterobasidion irregulare TC 32-1]|uniref:Esterase/lipase/thioesterase n=1 Tax=Heterobasidion irregulare (strain TC 32-1) TaxID=747525 RepID=W4K203_HETIT|nr:Esterase/lipase/thioesterase [Heterobasidion irregulare TC 32-1]ETW79838.1 Esterase/lipase/thioesterase [Heterobasidion irregulare TC 32-1]
MSQYAHLSTPDPEYAALKASLQMQPDLLTMRAVGVQMRAARPAPSLPADHDYRVEDRQISVEGGEITVRCYMPTPVAGGIFPLLVWYHGGGWVAGDLDMDDSNLRIVCVERHISIVSVDYRLAPEYPFPAGANDSYTALKWAAENAETLLTSPLKGFLVGGSSAGGNLAAAMTLRARDDPFFITLPLTGQLLQYPLVCHPDAYPERYKDELLSMEQNKDAPVIGKNMIYWCIDLLNPPVTDPDFSPLLATSHAGLPPACVQVCGLDALRDEGLLYEKVLKEQGVKTKLHIYPGVPHGVDSLFPELKASKKFENDFKEAIDWMVGLSAH